MGKSFAKGFSI